MGARRVKTDGVGKTLPATVVATFKLPEMTTAEIQTETETVEMEVLENDDTNTEAGVTVAEDAVQGFLPEIKAEPKTVETVLDGDETKIDSGEKAAEDAVNDFLRQCQEIFGITVK